MKYHYVLPLIAALTLSGCASWFDTSADTAPTPSTTSSSTNLNQETPVSTRTFPGVLTEAERLNQQATITMANGQEITFEIFGDEAPKTSSNFIALTKDTFYDNLTFHRVEPGFVVQGGDPSGNGTGGPGYKFEDETVTRNYDRGIVAMANSGPNTNGSQFFIMLADTPLPKLYTIFGKVMSGMDAVDTIKVGDVMKSVVIEPKK